jgi:phospholipid-binding lipoprotein MlaA
MSRRLLWLVSGKTFRPAAFAAMTLLLSGCASNPPVVDSPGEVAESSFSPLEVYDPLEGWNRRVYKFNAQADRYVLLPVVDAYKLTVPRIFRERISDFFTNLKTPIIFANELLQLKFSDALATALRFGANTTFGMFGFLDVATPMGLPKYQEDFGQTLGFWGVGAGGYLMLPILGPSNYRDATGTGVDVAASSAMDPLGALSLDSARPAFLTVNVVDARYQQPFRYFQTGSPFEYLLVRFAYTKKREIEIGPGIQWGRAIGRQEPDGYGEQRELAAGGSGHVP